MNAFLIKLHNTLEHTSLYHDSLPHFKYRLGKNFDDDLKFLLKGVSQFDLNSDSVLSEVLVHGPLAFPIGTTKDGQPFLAGAYYGRGRVIVVTHEAFLQSEVKLKLQRR